MNTEAFVEQHRIAMAQLAKRAQVDLVAMGAWRDFLRRLEAAEKAALTDGMRSEISPVGEVFYSCLGLMRLLSDGGSRLPAKQSVALVDEIRELGGCLERKQPLPPHHHVIWLDDDIPVRERIWS